MPLPITIFSDFSCPYSYVTEAALRKVAASGAGDVRYRALELYPASSPLPPPEEDDAWREQVGALAEAEGVPLRPPGFRPRTRKAHEAARMARDRGAEEGMRAAIFHAYWAEGADIGRIDVLTRLIAPLGIDPEDLKIALDIDRYREEVLRDQEIARRLGVVSTPTLYLGTGPAARVLLGAQSRAGLDSALAGGL